LIFTDLGKSCAIGTVRKENCRTATRDKKKKTFFFAFLENGVGYGASQMVAASEGGEFH